MAIREAGFVCTDLRGVSGGVDTSATWTATCGDLLAYTVRIADSGALTVEPMVQYFDGVLWPQPPAPPDRQPRLEFREPLR